ncbi:conserved hypothetical protein [Ricinus communis]|uniref:DNA 3'-5' helicase n=1 Tax=Ricinus communis TaxID=3988 RepID=B9SK67_RICCO|nr:conserved hypothetical protein [Ricinus communis]
MESALKKYFGFSGFRPYQKEVIEKILERKDCLVVMATGSGKSLCYQVPPLVAGKTAVVISPLISLMQDQVMALKQRGIRAEYLGTGQTDHSVHNSAQNGHFNLLFVTPEKACSLPVSFWSSLLKVGVCLLAVDEAHCISEWGHDFRVEYKQLYKLRNILLDVPFVGLTATATAKVRFDIINSLKMNDPYISVGSFDRKNLFYGVKHFNRGSQFMDELVQEISKFVGNGDSTIIYCTTVKDVEQVFQLLQQAGIRAGIYHGQMGNKAREESHKSFIRDELHVMVATIAFGMGIDKPNIRQVIHYGCPKSLESYYQESGRCGRDGIPSVCWLYYTGSDFAKGDFYCGAKRILDMHFDKLPLHGLGKGYSSNWWKALANQLICHGYLMETIKDVYKFVSVHTKGEKYLSSARPDYQPPLVLPLTDQMVDDEEYQCTTGGVENFNSLATLQSESFLEVEVQLYQKLLEERIKLARSIGTAPYAICGDQTIKRIALTRPSTKARLANIEGVNQHLVAKHGDRILQSIRHLTQELNLSLDGEASLQITVNTRKVCPTPNLQKTLSPAKFEAWKMWHEDGLSIHKIANLPSRQAPIKVETVCEYLLDAAQEGLEFDWIRFCSEIGLTGEIFSDIQGAIIKVGSREKLKPIKNELPEDVSYAHIKTFLAMQTSGMSLEGMQPSHLSPSKDDPVQNKVPANSVEIASLTTVTERKELKPDPIHDEDLCSPEKRQKTIITDGSSTALEATETSILDLLKNYDEGVSLSDILKHFKGSREDSVIDLLSSLEADFMIFKKNNLYRLL